MELWGAPFASKECGTRKGVLRSLGRCSRLGVSDVRFEGKAVASLPQSIGWRMLRQCASAGLTWKWLDLRFREIARVAAHPLLAKCAAHGKARCGVVGDLRGFV